MTPFSKWPPAKWNYDIVYNSAARIDRNNIFQMRSYLGHLASCNLPTAIWAGINDPCNYTACSLPSIIVRGPPVTQNKSQLMHVMNEVWHSKVCAEKGVQYCKVTTTCWRVMINRDIWAVFGSGRDIHISTALYCAYAEKALERLLETTGCKGCWGSFTHQIAP